MGHEIGRQAGHQSPCKTFWGVATFAASFALSATILSCGAAPTAVSAADGNGSVITTGSTTALCVVKDAPSCPNSVVPPSYATKVQGIIYSYCLECHDPNGIGAISGSSHPEGAPPGGYGNPNRTGNPNDPNDPNRPRFNSDHNQWDPSASRDWSDYNNIVRHARDMLNAVRTCVMPPRAGTVLSEEDETALLQWLACGAPDN